MSAPDVQLHELAVRARAGAIVEEDELDLADGHHVVDHHPPVEVPAPHHARVHHREVSIAEGLELRVRRLEPVHHLAALVGDDAPGRDHDAVDHSGRSFTRIVEHYPMVAWPVNAARRHAADRLLLPRRALSVLPLVEKCR